MPTSPAPDSGVAARQRFHALLALLLVVAAALTVYLPTPGDYWIRYDNEALIRNSPQVNALAGADKMAALATMFTSTHTASTNPSSPCRWQWTMRSSAGISPAFMRTRFCCMSSSSPCCSSCSSS